MDTRALTIDHYEEIISLWEVSGLSHRPQGRDSREHISAEMTNPLCRYIGAFDSTRLVGVVIANYDSRRGWINRLAVHPDYRGKRLARDLIAEAESFLHKQGALVIAALIEEDNATSIAAFAGTGYEVMDSIKYYSKRPFPGA